MSDTLAPPAPATFHRSALLEEAPALSTDGRTVTVRLVRWNAPKQVYDRGRRTPYAESYERGGLMVDVGGVGVPVEREHGGPIVGTITGTEDREDGLYATVRLSRSSAGTDMAADIADEIYRYVSVDFMDAPVPAGATAVVRRSARLRRLAFTLDPAHDSPIVSIRSNTSPDTEREHTDMPDTEDQTAPPAPPAPPAQTEPTLETPPIQRSRPTIGGAAAHTLGRFASMAHFYRSANDGDVTPADVERYQRALADILTGDLDGMIREQWIDEVINLRRQYAPTVAHWRSRPLPPKGMTFSQPVVTTRPTVAKQTAQKAEIESTTAVIGLEQWAIDTYAGGSDISIQALNRAEPDLLNELLRLYNIELAQAVNEDAVAALVAAAAVGVSGNTALEYTTAEDFSDLVIDASGLFMTAGKFRRPADQLAISVDLWKALGKARDASDRPLYPSLNPMNAHGTFSAGDPDGGNIVQIPWYVEPDLGSGIKGVIGVSDAFVSALGPVGTMQADVPSKLGRDVAVYQEAAFGAADATGLVQIVNVTP